MSLTLPLGLKTAIESGNCVLFIGAGIGHSMIGHDGNPIPDGASLADELARHFKIDTENHDLSKISQICTIRRSRAELDDYLRKRLANVEPNEQVKWLTRNRWKAIYTTNYDLGIERAYEHNSSPLQTPVSISATQDLRLYASLRGIVNIMDVEGRIVGVR